MLEPSRLPPSPELELHGADLEKRLATPSLRCACGRIYDSLNIDGRYRGQFADRSGWSARGVCGTLPMSLTASRGVGHPCRYVSSYLYHRAAATAPPPMPPCLGGSLSSLGWVGLDPTTTSWPHVSGRVGRDYADVPPTRALIRAGRQRLSIAVSLEPTPAPVRHEDFEGGPADVVAAPRLPCGAAVPSTTTAATMSRHLGRAVLMYLCTHQWPILSGQKSLAQQQRLEPAWAEGELRLTPLAKFRSGTIRLC